MASLTRVDADRQWLRPTVGLGGATSNPRETGFCAQTILRDGVFEVQDTRLDERFREHALVTGAPFIRWYAAAPLIVKGHRIGALCVMDVAARRLSAPDIAFLTSMAEVISRLLEERLVEDERDKALQLISESEQRPRFALDAAGIGDWDMDLRTNVARRSLMHDRCFGCVEAVVDWGSGFSGDTLAPAKRARSHQRRVL